MQHGNSTEQELQSVREEMRRLQDEHEMTKQAAVDRKTQDEAQIRELTDSLGDVRRVNDELRSTVTSKVDQCQRSFEELKQLEDKCRHLSDENSLLVRKNEELEHRNKNLQDKLNSQIYTRAAEYKQ